MNIDHIAEQAMKAVVEVGDFVGSSQSTIAQIHMKGVRDPQTDIDVRAEDMLIEKLHTIFPEAGFILEEGQSTRSKEFNWAIDPIEGTKLFSTFYPVFFTQIALIHKDDVLLTGIYCPVTKQLFRAVKGKGSYLNTHPLHLHYEGPLSQSLVGLEIGKIEAEGPYMRMLQKIAPVVHRLNMVSTVFAPYLLTNTVQAFVRYYNGPDHEYDLAPRWLLFTEANGAVHEHVYENKKLYIAAHPKLVHEIESTLDVRT